MEDGGLRSLPFSLFFFFLISDESHVKNAVRAVKGIAFFFFFDPTVFALYLWCCSQSLTVMQIHFLAVWRFWLSNNSDFVSLSKICKMFPSDHLSWNIAMCSQCVFTSELPCEKRPCPLKAKEMSKNKSAKSSRSCGEKLQRTAPLS